MDNKVVISTDNINIYVLMTVNANKIGKIILSVMILLGFSFSIGLFVFIPNEDSGEYFLLLIAALILFLFFPMKYLLWNLYGEEEIIINTKSISYSYSYGFIKTNLQTIKFNILGTGYEPIRISADNNELGKLNFYDYSVDTNLPFLIFQTSVLIPKEKLFEIDQMINEVFVNERYGEFRFHPYSLN